MKPAHSREFGPVFDAHDNYWEAGDAFTRNRDPKFAERGVTLVEIDRKLRYFINRL